MERDKRINPKFWSKRRIWFYFDGMRSWTWFNVWKNSGFITIRNPLFAVMIFRNRVAKFSHQ